MKLLIFFFLFLPLASAIEVSELDNYVIVRNNRGINASYTVISDDVKVFSLMSDESIALMPGNYEVQEDIGTNLIASAYIGSRDNGKYGDLKVIAIGVLLALVIFMINFLYKK